MKSRETTTAKVLDWITYSAVRLIAMVLGCFPIDANLRTARWIGAVWYYLVPRHRRRAMEHLRAAYPLERCEQRIAELALQSMQQMVMMAVEALFTPRLITEWTWPRYVRLVNIHEALRLLLDRKGVILVTGHYGNWELCGYLLACLGFKVVAVMRPLDNPYLNAFLMEARRKRGLELLYKKGATRTAGDVLRSGAALGFIADQNAGRKGVFVDFFGRPASTYKSIALLAMEQEAPIIVGCARRTSDRFEYEFNVQRIIHPHEWADRRDPLEWITAEYTKAIEDFVRQAPEQYLWMHRRWKSQPPERKRTASAPESEPDEALTDLADPSTI